MIRCEHCGSVLPDGAIFCGECGRAVSSAANRRSVAPEPVDRATPPPLQQPDQHGRRPDPAAEAWLPESTLDPATRAWLTGEDRRGSGPVAPVPVQTPDTLVTPGAHPSVPPAPDSFAPRSAPTHVHGADSGLGSWAGPAGSVPVEPPLDPDAFPAEPIVPEDDPEITRLAPRSTGPAPAQTNPSASPEPSSAQFESAAPAPFWAPQEPAVPAPSTPSWWIGRATDEPAETPAPSTSDVAAADTTTPEAGATQGEPAARSGAPSDAASYPDQPRAGDTAVVEPLVDRRPPRPTPLVQPGSHPTTCHVCGHQLEPDDIFCNACGAVRPAVTAAFTGPVMPLPVARPDWAAVAEDTDDRAEIVPPASPTEASRPHPDVRPTSPAPASPEPSEPSEPSEPLASPEPDVPPLPESPTAPSSAPGAERDDHGPEDAVAPPVPTAAPLPPVPGVTGPVLPLPVVDSMPSSTDADESAQLDEEQSAQVDEEQSAQVDDEPSAQLDEEQSAQVDDDEDVDQTRIVTKTATHAPFMLHFSTGERIGVHGTGLLGRLPRPQPGERFDDLLTIHDPGKSVSKTHLELGRDADDLWVSDRFSGNGTVVRHIDGSIRRCEPGRRYRVERGARVDIGEQFFLVQ